tara:strand:- start:544 stop:990 length:447 start_codon:yes stop_codon:yes gene_type:complete
MNLKNKFRNRSASRLACIQILYNSIILKKDINTIIEGYNSSFMDDLKKLFEVDSMDEDYFYELINEIKLSYDEIKNIIVDNLNSEWSYERINPIDKSVLIVGISEIRLNNLTPKKSILTEYIEFGYQLGSDSKFINKVLDIITFKYKA